MALAAAQIQPAITALEKKNDVLCINEMDVKKESVDVYSSQETKSSAVEGLAVSCRRYLMIVMPLVPSLLCGTSGHLGIRNRISNEARDKSKRL